MHASPNGNTETQLNAIQSDGFILTIRNHVIPSHSTSCNKTQTLRTFHEYHFTYAVALTLVQTIRLKLLTHCLVSNYTVIKKGQQLDYASTAFSKHELF